MHERRKNPHKSISTNYLAKGEKNTDMLASKGNKVFPGDVVSGARSSDNSDIIGNRQAPIPFCQIPLALHLRREEHSVRIYSLPWRPAEEKALKCEIGYRCWCRVGHVTESGDTSHILWNLAVSVRVFPPPNCARSFSQCVPNAHDQPMDGPFS